MGTEGSSWQKVAADQLGLLTRQDLCDTGLSRAKRRTLVDRGDLVPIGRRTLRIAAAPVSRSQQILAACLEADGFASHRTGAWVHGLSGFVPGLPPEVLVARPRHDPRRPLARVHTTTWLPDDDVTKVGAIPTLGVARTLLTLAALVPNELLRDRVRAAVDEAIRDGKASDRWLWWRLEQLRCRGRNGVSVFESILTARAGGQVTESWLERETLRTIADAGLPLPQCQARIEHRGAFLARVDFLYPPRAVIEVSGHRFHHSPLQQEADVRRRRGLIEQGYQVYEFTYDEIVGHPERLLATIRRILHAASLA